MLLGLGPLTRWKQQTAGALKNQLLVAGGIAISAALLINFSFDIPQYMGVLGMVLVFWILVTTLQEVLQRVNANPTNTSTFSRLRKLTPSHWGMVLGHLGFAITIIGITLVSNYEIERDVRMELGETVELGGYDFTFTDVKAIQGPNYTADMGVFDVNKDDEFIVHLEPEKRIYTVQRMPMTEAAVHSTVSRDLFIAMGEPLDDGAWAVRIYIKPFIVWIWAGAVVMAIGGIFSISDKRYRMTKAKKISTAINRMMGKASTPVANKKNESETSNQEVTE